MSHKQVVRAGKVTVATALFALFAIVFVFLVDLQTGGRVQESEAAIATTSVTVLNIAPQWDVDPAESPASTTTSPTNVGTSVTWTAQASDGNGEEYYLLICKNSASPTPNQSAAPQCNGGAANQWAVSTSTVSATQAVATHLAVAGDGETNQWWAWICDGNAGSPSCNLSSRQGTGDSGTPFNVNHRPLFSQFIDTSPTVPGGTVTWFSTSSDPDSDGGADTVQLHVCSTNSFVAGACAAVTLGTSTFVTSDPSANTTLASIYQDGNNTAFGFVVDEHGLESTDVAQGTDSILVVANAVPTMSSSSIVLNGAAPMQLTVPAGETTGFTVQFTIADDNSCVANGSTTFEIDPNAKVDLYRSGIGAGGCDLSGDYDPEACYPSAVGTGVWNLACSQDAGSCLGPLDPDATFTCTFPLWYIADATEAGSVFAGQDWRVSVQGLDDNGSTTVRREGDSPVEMLMSTFFDISTTTIAYGGLQPGQNNNPAPPRIVSLIATGNTGLDLTASGSDMCPTYPSCSGNPTSTIYVFEQRYALASTTWTSGDALTSTSSPETELNVLKSTATSTQESAPTYWGINVPSVLTLSGDYIGENTFYGVNGEPGEW